MLDHLTLPAGLAPVVDPLLAWAVEATVIAAALAVVAALLGRSRLLATRPATRHALWLLVLVKLATPPLLAWPWSVPRPSLAGVVVPAAVESSILAPRLRISTPPPLPDRSPTGVAASRPVAAAAPADPSSSRDGPLVAAAERPARRRHELAMMPSWRAWVALVWVGGGLILAARHTRRILRFRRCLDDVAPAPGWLLAEAGEIGRRLGVGVPPVRVVRRLGTPVLWCLGRPTLLVPERMLSTLARDGWPAILAHELAHLRRGDPWVRRLELVAGLAWWWNPLYWLVRRRLDFEAELACDAWAVWAAPKGRIAYAESLIRICTGLSPAGPPTPALGVAGTGHFFERRLTMILRSRSDHRLATPHLLAAALLAGLALPTWTWADPVAADDAPPVTQVARNGRGTSEPIDRIVLARAAEDPDPNPAFDPDPNPTFDPDSHVAFDLDLDDDDKPKSDDDDEPKSDDDKGKKGAAKARGESIKAEVRAKAALQRADEQRQAEMAKFQKQMEAMGKEMEAKFGPGSEFASSIQKNFGPDSDFVKNIEKEFGPDSAFVKNIEKEFGPDSAFVKNIEKNFGADSEFAQGIAKATATKRAGSKKTKDRSGDDAQDAATKDEGEDKAARDPKGKKKSETRTRTRTETRTRTQSEADRRASRIDSLEARINGLMAELERLKAESDGDKDGDADDQG